MKIIARVVYTVSVSDEAPDIPDIGRTIPPVESTIYLRASDGKLYSGELVRRSLERFPKQETANAVHKPV